MGCRQSLSDDGAVGSVGFMNALNSVGSARREAWASPWVRLFRGLALGFVLLGECLGASAMRLGVPVWEPSGAVGLILGTEDATPLTMERASRMEWITSPVLEASLSEWRVLGGTRTLADGRLRLEASMPAGEAQAFFRVREVPSGEVVTVRDAAGLRAAVASAGPGTRILLEPGTYPGGFHFANLRGTTNRPVILAAADPQRPPVIQGGANGMQLIDPQFVELHDLVFTGASGNGLNIDDGGSFDTPARGVVLRGLRVIDVGPTGNRDGIKLSGVVSFRVEGCTVERWGTGGSAVDMVGCHEGLIVSNLFRHLPSTASGTANGVQTKGGTRDVIIRGNRFEHAGARSVNIGGSTGLEFFRPPLPATGEKWEAKDIGVEGNTFVGSLSPIAFVGVDGAEVRFNTIYRPGRWVIRILQETTAAGFVPCRGGRFTGNLVVFHSGQWASGGVNVGGGTAPETFEFAGNAWYCLDAPGRSRPTLPVAEGGGTHGVAPRFVDEAGGDVRQAADSPLRHLGVEGL